MANALRKGLALLLAAVMLLSVSGCGEEEKPSVDPSEQQEQPVEPEKEEKPEEKPEDKTPEIPLEQFNDEIRAAKEKNDDIVGWLKIDDIKVDGAVVQGKDNKQYERQNEWKEYSWTGSYFADYECKLREGREGLSKNTVIYGHNVHFDDNKDGERFSQLFYFRDEEFAKKHPYVYFSLYDDQTAEGGERSKDEMVWEIFSVFYTTTDFDYIRINKDYRKPEDGEITDAQLMNIITEAQQRSEFVYDVPVTGEDKILTLSTCSYKFGRRNDVRFVVMAKLLDEDAPLKKEASLTVNANKKAVE